MPESFFLPDLLEQYMSRQGCSECWITVQEIRAGFPSLCLSGPAVAGFLHRCHTMAFPSCRYRVTRIEKIRDTVPPYRSVRRYLVQERQIARIDEH